MRWAISTLIFAWALLAAGCATHAARGQRHFARGEYVAAIWEYEKALEDRPDPRVALRLAAARLEMGEGEGALRALDAAARAGSPEAGALVAARSGACGVASARALTETHPGKGWAWALYGDALAGEGRRDEAAEAWRRCLERGGERRLRRAVLYNLTAALVRSGDYDEARRTAAMMIGEAGEGLSGGEAYLAGVAAYAAGDLDAARGSWARLGDQERSRALSAVGDQLHARGGE